MTDRERLVWEILNAALYDITSGDKNDGVIAIEEAIDLLEKPTQGEANES